MSTGLECLYVEAQPGQWYWLLASSRDGFDWMEDAQVVGPFASFDKADDHLHDHNANPGGFSKRHYDPAQPMGTSLRTAIARAVTPKAYSGDGYPLSQNGWWGS